MSGAWFLDLSNMERFKQEREAIAQLQETAHWLQGTHWKCNGKLSVEALLDIEGTSREVQMIYPDLFPALPPSVYPKNSEALWSSHQYGRGGHLCLEWRPDTWFPEVKGAQVLESAYKLLYIEQSSSSHLPQIAPSDHAISVGQDLRNSVCRLYIPSDLIDYLHQLAVGTGGTFKFSFHRQSNSFLVLPHEISASGSHLWRDDSMADEMSSLSKNIQLYSGLVYVTSLSEKTIRSIQNLAALEKIIQQITEAQKNLIDFSIWSSESENSIYVALLVDMIGQLHSFIWFDKKSGKIYPLDLVQSQYNPQNPRIPVKLQNLSSKSVAIVGLGSVGSKIAISLARTGIKQFHLVDDDIFLPENVCRNALDWRNVAEHKAHAINQYLSYISRDIKVDCSVLNVGGQESSALLDRTLIKLGQCDIVIDATANPTVFNLLASLSLQYQKPLLWIEVFTGGIGGMIARSRPNQDPSPHQMKISYAQFADSHPFPESTQTQNYEFADQEGNILAAIDAEVNILAGHATRFAIDTMIESRISIYPYSMYLIGFERSWVFCAPFDTIPIAVEHTMSEKEEIPIEPGTTSENLNFLSKLLQDAQNEVAST